MQRRELISGAIGLVGLSVLPNVTEAKEFPGAFYFRGSAATPESRIHVLFAGMRLTNYFGKVGVQQFHDAENHPHTVVVITIPEGYTHEQWVEAHDYCISCPEWAAWSKARPQGEFVDMLMQ